MSSKGATRSPAKTPTGARPAVRTPDKSSLPAKLREQPKSLDLKGGKVAKSKFRSFLLDADVCFFIKLIVEWRKCAIHLDCLVFGTNSRFGRDRIGRFATVSLQKVSKKTLRKFASIFQLSGWKDELKAHIGVSNYMNAYLYVVCHPNVQIRKRKSVYSCSNKCILFNF